MFTKIKCFLSSSFAISCYNAIFFADISPCPDFGQIIWNQSNLSDIVTFFESATIKNDDAIVPFSHNGYLI